MLTTSSSNDEVEEKEDLASGLVVLLIHLVFFSVTSDYFLLGY